MKDQILKLAGVKSEKELYKLFPDESSFLAKYGKQIKKLQMKQSIEKAQWGMNQSAVNSLNDAMNIANQQEFFIPQNELVGSPTTNAITKGVKAPIPYASYIGAATDIIGGATMIKKQKENVNNAKKKSLVTGIQADAAESRDVDFNRMNQQLMWNPAQNITSGNELYNPYGEGTNVLAKSGKKVKKAQQGFSAMLNNSGFGKFMNTPTSPNGTVPIGADVLSKATSALVNNGRGEDAGSMIGGGVGMAAGTIIGGPLGGMIGKTAGKFIGGAIDRSDNKIEDYNDQSGQNIARASGQNFIQNLYSQNSGYMEQGGNINPQVVKSIQGMTAEDYSRFAHQMRTGGNLRQNEMDGDLQVYGEGGVRNISHNPYIPGGGQNVQFEGPSHDDGGINVAYGGNPVEVEPEPATKINDDLVVFGDLHDRVTGKKFKSIAKEMDKKVGSINKTMEKTFIKAGELEPLTPIDRLSMNSFKATTLGANMKLKALAEEKMDLAARQSAINDTAEELKLDANSLSKGKIQKAKYGHIIPKAKTGVEQPSEEYKRWLAQHLAKSNSNAVVSPSMQPTNVFGERNTFPKIDTHTDIYDKGLESLQQISATPQERLKTTTEDTTLNPWIMGANALIPFIRPSDVEQLDPRQLYGEMNALATNQLEPVQAQTYQPQLAQPYDISFQDRLNEITAQERAASKAVGYNPAAQAAIAASAYGPKSGVLAEQFRANQAMKDKTYGENRTALNDAQLKNLALYDQQYARQAQAKSSTKETAQAALSSISSKYLQNTLENRKLAIAENLYNYRFDDKGRAWNLNPLAQFNMAGNATKGQGSVTGIPDDWMTLYDENGKFQGTKKRPKSENGSIVKAFRNL